MSIYDKKQRLDWSVRVQVIIDSLPSTSPLPTQTEAAAAKRLITWLSNIVAPRATAGKEFNKQ